MRAALLNAVWVAVGAAIGCVINGWSWESSARVVLIAFMACAWGHWLGQHHRERSGARAR